MTKETNTKRLLFTTGGKGGVGKTTISTAIVDYLLSQEIPVKIFDFDGGNRNVGSLHHYYPNQCEKLNLDSAGLDRMAEAVLENRLCLADMPAGAENAFSRWFQEMGDELKASGVAFTAVSSITPMRASIATVYDWSNVLKGAVDYLILKNHGFGSDFGLFDDTEQGQQFRKAAKPTVIDFEARYSLIQAELEDRGLTPYTAQSADAEKLGDYLSGQVAGMRLRGILNRSNETFDIAKEALLP